jgi:hypothetical protein
MRRETKQRSIRNLLKYEINREKYIRLAVKYKRVVQKINKVQFKVGKLGGPDRSRCPKIRRAALAA